MIVEVYSTRILPVDDGIEEKICTDNSLYVSEFCEEAYEEFFPFHTYLINCPTGKGKSHMCIEKILPKALKEGKRVLLLGNRTKLIDQYKKQIQTGVYNRTYARNPIIEDLNGGKKPSVLVGTYQEIEQRLLRDFNGFLKELDLFDIVIADEIHYFLNDSTFNPFTRLSAEAILMYLMPKTRYLMSATMEDIRPIVFEPHKYIEKPLFDDETRYYAKRAIYEGGERKKINTNGALFKEYVMPRDYSYLDIRYFNRIDSIIDEIVYSSSDEKWLIFINNKKEAEWLVNEINDKYKEEKEVDQVAVFISADYRVLRQDMKEVLDEITEDEDVKNKVLVSTSVLDNGINLKSKNLRNIVICTDNDVSFIQMLGRKRIIANEQVKLYIPSYSLSFFEKRRKMVEDTIYAVSQVPMSELSTYASDVFYSDNNEIKKTLKKLMFPLEVTTYDEKNILYVLNTLSFEQLLILREKYKVIVDSFREIGEHAYILIQLSWLGIEYNEEKWIPDSYKEAIKKIVIEALEKVLGIPYEIEDLKNSIVYVAKYTKHILEGGRGNRLSIPEIEKIIQILELDYVVIKNEDKKFVIKKIGEEKGSR